MGVTNEIQKALFLAMTSTSALTSVVNSIYDVPGDNEDYPYIVLENKTILPYNIHGKIGFQHLFTFGGYDMPGRLGTYNLDNIVDGMNAALNMVRKTLTTTTFKMVACKLVSAIYNTTDDVKNVNMTYNIIVMDDNNTIGIGGI